MTSFTNPWFLRLRRLGRRTGLNRIVGRLRGGATYERKFDEAVTAAIRPGDTVWDVGANVGHYTVQFADLTGPAGRVVAFEPSPLNAARLRSAVETRANVVVMPVGLADRQSQLAVSQGADELGATTRLVAGATGSGARVHTVAVHRGQDLVERGEVPFPNVIKIDTEGFELEVLTGLGALLPVPSLRAVCVEVHFAILDERGMREAPSEIVRLLEGAGLRVRWPDASHLVGERRA